MADENITPIRPNLVPRTVIETRDEQTRELIFRAQAIIQLAMRAAMSDEKDPDWTMKNALGTADGLLDEAATQLEPGAIDAEAEVAA